MYDHSMPEDISLFWSLLVAAIGVALLLYGCWPWLRRK